MKLKDKSLISYFETDMVTRKLLKDKKKHLRLNFANGPIDLDEVSKLITTYPFSIKSISIDSSDFETIRNTLLSLPSNSIEKVCICCHGRTRIKADDFVKFPNLEKLKIIAKGKATLKKCEVPPTVKQLRIANFAKIEDIDLSRTTEKPIIEFAALTERLFSSLSLEIASLADIVVFNEEDRFVDTISIRDLLRKFHNASVINRPPFIKNNISSLSEITDLLKKSGVVYMAPEIMRIYRNYYESHIDRIKPYISLGSTQAITETYNEGLNNNNRNEIFYPASELKYYQDFSTFYDLSQEGKVIFYGQNMLDFPMDIVERLKEEKVECYIEMISNDNTEYQNSIYTLDEYISIYKTMNQLIGDIDENLPEEEKFGKIYTRIISFLEYDSHAAYPITRAQKKYAEENIYSSRNLLNGLLKGQCVCAGYADILKNALLLKGIECEYIGGPVDMIKSRINYYLDKILDGDDVEILQNNPGNVVVRDYHAWNKVKINGVWYNCDPTIDKYYISKNQVPRYALISDDVLECLGRPTTMLARCPCDVSMSLNERNKIFHYLKPQKGKLAIDEDLIDFENTLDEFGDPPMLLYDQEKTIWEKILYNLKVFGYKSKRFLSQLKNNSRLATNAYAPKPNKKAIANYRRVNPWELTDEELKRVKSKERRVEDYNDKNDAIEKDSFDRLE